MGSTAELNQRAGSIIPSARDYLLDTVGNTRQVPWLTGKNPFTNMGCISRFSKYLQSEIACLVKENFLFEHQKSQARMM